jgi:hypothetical protein
MLALGAGPALFSGVYSYRPPYALSEDPWVPHGRDGAVSPLAAARAGYPCWCRAALHCNTARMDASHADVWRSQCLPESVGARAATWRGCPALLAKLARRRSREGDARDVFADASLVQRAVSRMLPEFRRLLSQDDAVLLSLLVPSLPEHVRSSLAIVVAAKFGAPQCLRVLLPLTAWQRQPYQHAPLAWSLLEGRPAVVAAAMEAPAPAPQLRAGFAALVQMGARSALADADLLLAALARLGREDLCGGEACDAACPPVQQSMLALQLAAWQDRVPMGVSHHGRGRWFADALPDATVKRLVKRAVTEDPDRARAWLLTAGAALLDERQQLPPTPPLDAAGVAAALAGPAVARGVVWAAEGEPVDEDPYGVWAAQLELEA